MKTAKTKKERAELLRKWLIRRDRKLAKIGQEHQDWVAQQPDQMERARQRAAKLAASGTSNKQPNVA